MLSKPTQKYLQTMASFDLPKTEEETLPKIHADYVASKFATLYEKLRQVIDFQEEHLLRKNAIDRILKRRLILSSDPEEIVSSLVYELIRGGYFPNDKIPEIRIEEVKKALKKYIFLIKNIPGTLDSSERNQLSLWLQSLAACEIEEILSPPVKEKALLEYMYETMQGKISAINGITEQKKNFYIFIACQKALLKSDKSLISFRVFQRYIPNWSEINEEGFTDLSQEIYSLKDKINEEISSSLSKKILEIVSQYTAPFLIIGDVVSENPKETTSLFEKPEVLDQKLFKAYSERHENCRKKIQRSGIRSVISIFLSKVALAFLIEIPFDVYVTKKFSYLAMGINIFIPVSLMFLIISTIKVPKSEAAPQVVMEAMKVIQETQNPKTYEIRPSRKRSFFLSTFLNLINFIVSGAVFGIMIYILAKMNLSVLSILIFLIFFCLISFSAIKIRQWTKELKITPEKEGIAAFLIDLLFLPFVRVEKWLSVKVQKYNIFILLLNLFFEAPLQTFFEFVESWRGYLKEKKAEIE